MTALPARARFTRSGQGKARTVGVAAVVLVVALMVVPAATALLFTRSLGSTVLVAVVVALVGSQLGFWLAYLIDAATSPMMALLDGVIFLAVWLVTWLRARA